MGSQDPDQLPLGGRERAVVGQDGIRRRIEVTAFPLFAHADDMVGAVAIFWEPEAE